MAESPEYYLEKMRHSPPLDPELATRINDPARVARLIGLPMQFSASVEGEVAASGGIAEALLVTMDPELEEFFSLWYPHEKGHSDGQRASLALMNREPLPQKRNKVTHIHRGVGRIANRQPRAHDIAELGLLTYMAIGEHETLGAYLAIDRLLVRHDEPHLARFFGMSAHQEGFHLGFQTARARRLSRTMPQQDVRLVGTIIEHFYKPVGVSGRDRQRMRSMGHMIRAVSDDRGVKMAGEVAGLVHSIIPTVQPTSTFALNQYRRCLAAS